MPPIRTLTPCLAILAHLAAGSALADTPAAFAEQEGYVAQDPDRVSERILADLPPADGSSVFLPTADIAPAVMAVLALQAHEPEISRARYRLRFGSEVFREPGTGSESPVSYVEVVRFNLGPVFRRNLMQPEAQHADAPHVGWRIVSQPLMGNKTILITAGRAELPEPVAAEQTCHGLPCLDLTYDAGDLVPWGAFRPETLALDTAYPQHIGRVLTPAAALEVMLGEVLSIETEGMADADGVPPLVIEVVIDTVAGNNASTDAALRWGGLLDDSVRAEWQRILSFPLDGDDLVVFRADTWECARGPDFPDPGSFCP